MQMSVRHWQVQLPDRKLRPVCVLKLHPIEAAPVAAIMCSQVLVTEFSYNLWHCNSVVQRLSRPVSFEFKLTAGLFGHGPIFLIEPNVSAVEL